MRCEVAERELSARSDGAVDRRLDDRLEDHLATCSRCRAFAAGTQRVRELVRLEAAEPVPNLVPRIMARVRGEVRERRLPVRIPVREIFRERAWARYAVAFAASALVVALVLGGFPGLRSGPDPALATEIPQRIAEASAGVDAYRAVFDVTERNFHEQVPTRRFTARIAFESPERFRARVVDDTPYPSDRWPRNELVLGVDGSRWLVSGPATCPREGLPACAPGGQDVRAVRGREPFDGDALLPTDIVLPVRTLSGTSRVQVVGEGEVLGRDVVTVALAYRDATPLFSYLHAGGSWRPFFPLDRVEISLDRETWFPLAYGVFPAAGGERDQWALRHSLPPEDPDERVFEAMARSFNSGPRPSGWRPVPSSPVRPRDAAFRDLSFEALAAAIGHEVITPSDTAGLEPYRAGVFVSGSRPADQALLSYATGLSWLKIRESRLCCEPYLQEAAGPIATPVRLPGGGIGYYGPASASLGRRIFLQGGGWEVYVETNLPRKDLLRVAGSLPVQGERLARDRLTRHFPGGVILAHVRLSRALELAPYLLLPDFLPPEYRLWTIQVVRARGDSGVTMFFRRPAAELYGEGIRLYQAAGEGLAPPMDPDLFAVRVRGQTGRYSPTRGDLEWVEGGVYRSLRAEGFDLATLLRVAESLRPAGR